MTVDLVPPKGKVIIRKDEPPKLTLGGIHLRANDRTRSNTGMIVGVNENRGYISGQKIYFDPQVSSTINFNDENLVIIFESDILGVVV